MPIISLAVQRLSSIRSYGPVGPGRAEAASGEHTHVACWRMHSAFANFLTRLFRQNAETSTRNACAFQMMRISTKLFAESSAELCARVFAVELRNETGANLGWTHRFALVRVGAITKSLLVHYLNHFQHAS